MVLSPHKCLDYPLSYTTKDGRRADKGPDFEEASRLYGGDGINSRFHRFPDHHHHNFVHSSEKAFDKVDGNEKKLEKADSTSSGDPSNRKMKVCILTGGMGEIKRFDLQLVSIASSSRS